MSRPIKTVLLSFGMSGRVFHAPFIRQHAGFQLLGAWERSKRQVEAAYPGTISFPSLEAVLDSEAELVVVNTPNDTHFDFASRALRAGKHVIVEKSFTATQAEAESLNRQARMAGLQIAVFQNRRWDSDFKSVKDILSSGILGEPIEAQFGYDRFNPGLSAKLHKENPTPGAGVLRDLGPHLIDQALVLFGMPQAVFADLRVTRERSLVQDYLEILMYYPRLRVRLHSGYFNCEPVSAYVVHGTRGSFHHDRTDVQESRLQSGASPGTPDWGQDNSPGRITLMQDGRPVRREIPTPNGDYMDFYAGVHQALRQGSNMPVTAEDGVRVMTIIEAAETSAREMRVVPLIGTSG